MEESFSTTPRWFFYLKCDMIFKNCPANMSVCDFKYCLSKMTLQFFYPVWIQSKCQNLWIFICITLHVTSKVIHPKYYKHLKKASNLDFAIVQKTWKVKEITHYLNHDLTFYCTHNQFCVPQSKINVYSTWDV